MSILQIGNILIHVDIDLKGCCAQFYCLELDHKIGVGDLVLRVSYSSRNACLLCWSYSKDLFGKLGWRYIGDNDTSYNIKVNDNKIWAITSQ